MLSSYHTQNKTTTTTTTTRKRRKTSEQRHKGVINQEMPLFQNPT
jgi:hypothetical protein